ncbi:MAG: RNB domain-containing ribonuclease [Cephaloticoccus sp.]|nr:RNB domain-containing ribonuclease [Cephaloticoccus sp.]MCF7760967.1 RNB domain-containing ribonuclease [Cephaloticoccus sp.]
MNLRDRLLAHLRGANYRPVAESVLLRQLGLPKNQKSQLARKIRQLNQAGQLVRNHEGSLKLIQTGKELTGHIRFRAGGSAFVVLDEVHENQPEQPSIQISPDATDVALHGDHVVVRILPGVRTRRAGEKAGKIMRVLERAKDTIVGDLRKSGRQWMVIPDDPRLVHEVLVKSPDQLKIKPTPAGGDKVVVRLNEWRSRRDPLTGAITARLGRTHEPRAEMLGIFEKYGLATSFPAAVEQEVAQIPDKVLPREIVGRLDYRAVPTFTIDPDDAKDFDDALSIEHLDHGEIRIGVHIADVSAYVKSGTALDREAQRRGNSTYLVGTVIPMLPEKLSNGLCSLVEGENRLTKAVFLTFSKNGRLRDKSYGNTVIRSTKRLTYKQAYALLFEDDLKKIRALPLPPKHQTGSTGRALNSLSGSELQDLQNWVRQMWLIAAQLRQSRMEKGSLDLDMPETKIFVDEQGYADRLERVDNDESHQLIEEFMLAANEAVAHITRIHRLPSLYRVHDDPDDEKLAELRQLLGTHGIKVGDLSVRDEVVKLLRVLQDHPQGYTLRTQLLRSLRKACYRSSPDGHYGLNKRDYTHFTSPIRRYADLVVHRVFDSYLIKHAGYPAHPDKQAGYNAARIESMAEHISLTEINSQEAERDSVKIKLLEFFERELDRKPRTVFKAIITDVRPNGFFVELLESMTFGLVPMTALRGDHYFPAQDGTALIGRKSKRRFALNDRLDVVVDKVDRFKRLIDFRPVDGS